MIAEEWRRLKKRRDVALPFAGATVIVAVKVEVENFLRLRRKEMEERQTLLEEKEGDDEEEEKEVAHARTYRR